MRIKMSVIAPLFNILLPAACLSLSVSVDSSAQSKSAVFDTLLHTLAARGQFNGSVLVAERGRVIYENAFGEADFKNHIAFTPATPCYLASLAKQFTAMAVMILEEQHKLSYLDPLSQYFPDFPAYARKVTISHLLNHTSGMPDYARLGLERPGLTNNDVLAALLHQDSLDFQPGEKYRYSNSGYVLLAMIVEKVSGQKYGAFLKRYIFDPLGMNHTFVRDESHREISGAARGYSRFGDDDDYDLLTHGEGGIYSSVDDLFKWDQALYTEKLVGSRTLSEAFAKPTLNDGSASNYGFGWAIAEYNGETIFAHAGRYGGFNTYIKRFPRERNTIIFLTNHDFKDMGTIGNALIGILYNTPPTLPKLSVAEAMARTYAAKGLAAALEQYRALKEHNDTTYDFRESELNELGYHLLNLDRTADAIVILGLNAQAFPSSWNVYDSLGDAYMKNGDHDLAITNYRKALELNSEDSNAASALRGLDKK